MFEQEDGNGESGILGSLFVFSTEKRNKASANLDGHIGVNMLNVSDPYKHPPGHVYRDVKTKEQVSVRNAESRAEAKWAEKPFFPL